MRGSGNRRTDGTTSGTTTININEMKCRGTVWNYLMAGDKNKLKRMHPAPFPDQIPYDIITCFCPKKGVVIDPFVGSGSTCVTAKRLGRNFIGIDIKGARIWTGAKKSTNLKMKNICFIRNFIILSVSFTKIVKVKEVN